MTEIRWSRDQSDGVVGERVVDLSGERWGLKYFTTK